ncbi:Cna B-type domain-containing protein [Carnobacteriaceae bacterium zg-84]|uniref:Cna B-type domain-containing protein n=1 Tax=Granulicatella sp. zg-84 TaxID=2678503 RepID=UPI0013BED41C|nr:Cna B-type domain-containing protein [Granulicatella sp. zg-84]NEW66950.1 Cna B-type domain-containing protein [Granulicatella sp. zg-84]QMI85762.1 Cna B-type domain-containing protein [Carnobacteriaceae bacterium zg-84]
MWNYNNLLTNVSSYEILDVLPHLNDFSTAASATSGQLEPRQSKFSNTLTGPIHITTPNAHKFTVEYSTDEITGPVDQSSNTLSFSETVADYAQVTAIRVRLKDGQTFNKGELLEVEVPMKAPEMANLGDRAWNNFSIATNTNQPTPTNLVWNEMYIPSSPLKIVKKSVEGTLLAGAVFTVTRMDNPEVTYELTTNKNGVVEQVLPLGTYKVVEKTAPTGYLLDTTEHQVEIVEDETTTLELANVPLISVTVNKVWDDDDNRDAKRPNTIQVHLLANGAEKQAVTLSNAENWTHTFMDLPAYENGQKIAYTVTEDAVADYETTINGYTITNRHIPEVKSITINKIWNDNNDQDGKRPNTIHVHLFANGVERETATLTNEDNWTHTFEYLPVYENGQEIAYTVTEDAVEGYETTIDGYTITNVHTPEVKSITVNKVWNDHDNQDGQRPNTIQVHLLANGTEKQTVVLSNEENWMYTFTNLPVYENGQEINYTVTEEAVAGYESVVDGYTITNRHTPKMKSITVNKVWDDNNNQDGKRPESIKAHLLANGEVIRTQNITKEMNWMYIFENVPEYENGQKIEYTVKEDVVSEYESSVDGYTITNKYIPKTKSVTVNKIWNDNNDQDGKRPDKITVHLFANGIEKQQVFVTEANAWTYTFENLPVYENGQEINYTVTEDAVEGYETVVNDTTIMNIHKPSFIDVPVNKVWEDDHDRDGKRPKSVTLHLLANGEQVDSVTVTKDSQWQHVFKDVPEFKDGKRIVYTVSEDAVEGYTANVSGTTVTNTRSVNRINIPVTKQWVDNDNQDGKRPEQITVHLLANGEIVRTQDITREMNWMYVFANVLEYENGQKIEYTIKEDVVPFYEITINGFDLTNTLKEEPKKPTPIPNKETPEITTTSTISKETTTSTIPDKPTLPKTGSREYNMTIIGLGILMIGFGVVCDRKKHID